MTGAMTAGETAAWWPVPGAESYKYTCGVVGIDAGSPQYPGAALLVIPDAFGAGPGMVRYLGSVPRDLVVGRFPSVVFADGQVQTAVAGSGWDTLVDAGSRLREALEWRVPLAIDMDVLRLLPVGLPVETLLTPHMGELARFLGVERGEIEADPVVAMVLATGRFGATVFLEGAVQLAISPDGLVRLALSDPVWMAQVGSDNVLAGAYGTLLAVGLPAGRAGLMAASLQVLTASRFPEPCPPDVQASRFLEVVWGLLAPDQQWLQTPAESPHAFEWGLAGCFADEEPAATEGVFNNELHFTEPRYPWVLNSGEANILHICKIFSVRVVFYTIS